MAIRIIAEAGVRLVADGRGLGVQMRAIIGKAMQEATAGVNLDSKTLASPTKKMADDADKDSNRIRNSLRKILNIGEKVGRGFASTIGNGMKLALIGTAAAGALAGVTSLAVGLFSLGQAAVQASGVVALLPAAFAAFKAVSATIKLGMSGLSDSFKALGSGDMAAFNESLKKLAPSAREFATAVRDIKPGFDQLKMDVQQRMFLGLAEPLKQLSSNYLPVANRLFVTIAGSINNAGKDVAAFANQASTVAKVTDTTDNLRSAVNLLAPAFRPALSALLDITNVGSSFLPAMSAQVTALAQRFGAFISQAAADGRLAAFIQGAIDALKTLGAIVQNVFGIFRNVMDAAHASGTGLLENIKNITGQVKEFTGSFQGQQALTGFFESMRRVLAAVGPAFFSLVTIIGRDFIPILADIAEVIGPVLKPLFEALGRLLQALRPLFQVLAEAIGEVMAAFGPVIDAFAEALNGAMPQLRPVIRDIGKALADLVKAMVPLAPLFVQLLTTLLPVIPPFIQIVVEIMPELIRLVQAFMPLIQALANAFIAIAPVIATVANILLNILVPVIEFVIGIISGLLNIVVSVFQGIWNVITTVVGAIADFFVSIWQGISDFFSGIWDAIKGVFSGSLSAIWEGIKSTFGDIGNAVLGVMGNILRGVGDAIGGVVDWFLSLPGKIWDAVKDAAKWLYETGKNIIMGLINGIKDMFKKIISAITDVVTGAVDAAKSALGINSPSRVFAEIGRNVGEGLVNGIAGMQGAAADAAAGLAGAATTAAGIALAAPGTPAAAPGTAAAGGINVNQTIVARPGTDINQLANTVLRRGFGDFLSGASTLSVGRQPVQAGINDQWVTA